MEFAVVVLLIGASLIFDYINGFHDAANSIATVVSTRVLSPGKAVVWAAFFNFAAFFIFGTAVAKTIGSGMIDIHVVTFAVIFAGLFGAIVWDLITWHYGLPTSSSHALIGGYAGAAVAEAGWGAIIPGGWTKTLLFIVVSPVVGLIAGLVLMVAIYWVFQSTTPKRVDYWFRKLQLVSAALFSLNHGANDAQKTMGIMAGVLATAGYMDKDHFMIPTWVVLAAYTAIGLGTLSGGWRIIHTMGSRITKLEPVARVRGGNRRRRRGLHGNRPRGSREYDACDHRGNCGRRLDAAPVGRPLGSGRPDRLGVGPDHPRRGVARRRHGAAAEGVRHPVGRAACRLV